MDTDDPDLQVRPDDYRATTADVLLSARLHSSLAVCLYDETESEGALLHLRLAAPGCARDPELTDNTLSGDMALLDRALRELAAASPRARHWRAKLVAQSEDQETARLRCEGLQAFLVAFLQDAGVTVMDAKVHVAGTVIVNFRPALGEVHTKISESAP